MSRARAALLAFLITALTSGVLGPLYTVVMVVNGSDPWFGAHAALVCSRTCDGCRGPYHTGGGTRVNGSSRGGKASKLYCTSPLGEQRPEAEVPNGDLLGIAAGIAVVGPITWLVLYLIMRRRRPISTSR